MGAFGWLLVLLIVAAIVALIIWLCTCNKKCGKKSKSCCSKCGKTDCDCDETCSTASGCQDECCTTDNVCCLFERFKKEQLIVNDGVTSSLQALSAKQHDYFGTWTIDLGVTPTGTVSNVALLKSAATPQGTAILHDAQAGTSSINQAPFPGLLDAFSVQIGGLVTAGTATFTVLINGSPTLLQAPYTSLTGTGNLTVYPATPIAFAAGDRIGVSYSAAGVTYSVDAVSVTVTSDIYVKWTA